MNKSYVPVLTIAGSDPSGGAGIQADLKTFSALGCYGMSVITALTAQNTQGVQSVLPVDAFFVNEQLDSIFQDIQIAAVKTGMLHNKNIIHAITHFFQTQTYFNSYYLIVDPVLTATNGGVLLEANAIDTLRQNLLPIASLITPNIPEAEILIGQSIKNQTQMETAAKQLVAMGCQAVLLKGGHLEKGESNDCFFSVEKNEVVWLNATRIDTGNTHGTGCTLSAAITALVGQGMSLLDAIKLGKTYLHRAISEGASYKLGKGQGPVHHFYHVWKNYHI